VFWHPRGFALYRAVEDYMRRRVRRDGYQEVRSPMLLPLSMWRRSGHWDVYSRNMFAIEPGDGGRELAVKPMNCPGHVQIFRHGVRSWRDLPVRLAEFGICHRDEPSGALHGLLRLRGFVQDDGHIFCRPDQVDAEVARFCVLLRSVYADFGFHDIEVGLSLRPAQRKGSDADWDRSEALLANAADAAGLSPKPMPGAFYGPKLEFGLRDRLGRPWQCGTLQLDVVLPALLGASYRDGSDANASPILLHRAVLGSLERFVGILLEHHEGNLPVWLAPEQVLVASVADRHADYARRVASAFEAAGVRAKVADGQDRLPAKIRDAAMLRVPAVAVVGDRECADGGIALRWQGRQENLRLEDAVSVLHQAAAVPR
jgi:threonyl-tRNA synthetase